MSLGLSASIAIFLFVNVLGWGMNIVGVVFGPIFDYLGMGASNLIVAFMLYAFFPVFLSLSTYDFLTPHESKETRCRKCGYILKGITEPRCSECGERI